MAHLAISLLGPFRVTLDGQPVTRFEMDAARALLSYLAVAPETPFRRNHLAGLLWPELPESNALHSLRQTLLRLRHAIGDRQATPPFLLITRNTVQFNPDSDYELDAAAFSDLINASKKHPYRDQQGCKPCMDHLRRAAELYRDDFTADFALNSAAYEEWLVVQREALHRQAIDLLYQLAAYHEGLGEFGEVERFARRQSGLEPWHEPAHRQLMRALALGGQRVAAVAQYEICRRTLANELGLEPEEKTTALCTAIRAGRPSGMVTVPPSADVSLSRRPPLITPASGRPITPAIPFVARDRELARLDAHLRKALTGMGRVSFITGIAGTGKTALANEFVRQAAAAYPDLLVATGGCNEYAGVGSPYLPFREILRLCSDQRDVVTPTQHAAPPEEMALYQPHLFEQVTDTLITIASRQPLLLVLDDLQWADAASISLLFHLGRRLAGARVLIVGAYRSGAVARGRHGARHPLASVVNEFQSQFGGIQIDLDAASGREFVEALVDSEPNHLDATFREALYRHTLGYPLFTVESLRDMRARGDLRQDLAGFWTAMPNPNWRRLPAAVEAIIAERLARVPADWRSALTAASVEGEEFTAEVIARAAGVKDRDLIRHLDGELDHQHHLVRGSALRRLPCNPLLDSASGGRLSCYRFRYRVYQQYLYRNINPVRRARLHEAVGNALEAVYLDAPAYLASLAPRLVWHFAEAGVTARAAVYQ